MSKLRLVIRNKGMIPTKGSSHVCTQTVLFHNAGHDHCFRCGGKVKHSDQGIRFTDAEFAGARSGAHARWIARVYGPAGEKASPIELGRGIPREKQNPADRFSSG